jgi:hypothetical protein
VELSTRRRDDGKDVLASSSAGTDDCPAGSARRKRLRPAFPRCALAMSDAKGERKARLLHSAQSIVTADEHQGPTGSWR